MKVFLLPFILISIASFAQLSDEQQVLKVLERQAQMWNRGDLKQFMHGYWVNDSLMFIGKSGVTYGYENTLKSYQTNYGDSARMGKLIFDIIHVKRLSPEYFFVVGKYTLKRSIGDASGHYTLLFRKVNGEWVVVADHSS